MNKLKQFGSWLFKWLIVLLVIILAELSLRAYFGLWPFGPDLL